MKRKSEHQDLDFKEEHVFLINELLSKDYSFKTIVSLDTKNVLKLLDELANFVSVDTKTNELDDRGLEVDYTIASLIRMLGTRDDF